MGLTMGIEKCGGFVVTFDGIWQENVHMEHMTHFFVIFAAIAFPGGIYALLTKEIVHGLRTFPEEVPAGRGDIGWRIVGCDVFKHCESGVLRRELSAQIVQVELLSGLGGGAFHIIQTAV